MVPALLFSVYAALMLAAAVWDGTSLTIPNRLNATLAVLFVPAALVAGLSPLEAALCLGFGVAVLAVGMGLFAMNVAGGGDAKLLAAAGLWLGPQAGMSFLFWTVMAGGLLAVALIVVRRASVPLAPVAPRWAAPLLTQGGPVPYGVAIAAGAIVAWPMGALAG